MSNYFARLITFSSTAQHILRKATKDKEKEEIRLLVNSLREKNSKKIHAHEKKTFANANTYPLFSLFGIIAHLYNDLNREKKNLIKLDQINIFDFDFRQFFYLSFRFVILNE